MAKPVINEVEKVEILSLQDNYIDMTAADSNAVISRARPLKDGQIRASILAEHGFSALVKTSANDRTRTMLFDFGFSEDGAAYNASTLGIDMNQVEVIALSHGHSDHMGGMERLTALIGRREIPLVVHPAAYKSPRYLKYGEDLKIHFPQFTQERAVQAGLRVVEAPGPYPLLDGDVLFLGQIPRRTDFEKGFPIAHFEKDGIELKDDIEDDTSIVMNLKGKGLIILSGCAHAGIINTVRHAVAVTGVAQVHVVMGGFHLSGPLFEGIIDRTVAELNAIHPTYVVPCHCTGRKAVMAMEKAMPEQFLFNMSGTTLTFTA